MALLTNDEIKEAKAWLHDVFVWGGLVANPKRAVPIEKYRYMYGTSPDNFRQDDPKYRDAAKTVCSCIMNRKVETQRFLAFDAAIKLLSSCAFLPGLSVTRGYIRVGVETLCRFIAWFCDENNLVYNNRNTSVEEMKQITEHTLIGKTLWDNYLFAVGNIPEINPDKHQGTHDTTKTSTATADTSAAAAPASASSGTTGTAAQSTPTTSAPTGNNGAPTAATVKTGGPAGHTLYRNNAGGILTQGKLTKITNSHYVYWIGGEFTNPGKTQPKLHVKPQGSKSPLKVDYGSGQGYNDCILYFASELAARNFMGIADANKPSKVKSLRLKKINEDKNGYVEVETEFGNAYIKASKLHEDVKEDLENKEEEKTYNYKEVAEAYFNGFFKD